MTSQSIQPVSAESDARQREDATRAIAATDIVSVWEVSYERKIGRKWEARRDFYLIYEQAKHCYELAKADADRNPKECRNVERKACNVFTHTYSNSRRD